MKFINTYFFYLLFIFFFLACKTGQQTAKNTTRFNVKDKKEKETQNSPKQLTAEEVTYAFVFFNANKEKLLGNYEKSAGLFEQCTTLNPSEPAAFYELGMIYDFVNLPQQALANAKKAVDLDGDNYWYRYMYAKILAKNGSIKEAIRQYEILADKFPDDIDVLYDIANLNFFNENYEKAIEAYNKLEKKAGINESIIMQKEKAYIRLGDVEGAANEIKKLIEAYPDEVRYYGVLGDLYMVNGLTDKAFETFQKVLEIDPEEPYIHLSLSDYYRATGNPEKAFEELQLAFQSRTLDIDQKMSILLSFYDASEVDSTAKMQAYNLAEILMETHPDDAKAYTIYADLLYRDKKIKEAKKYYLKAVNLDNSRIAIWNQLLFIDADLRNYSSMDSLSTKALEFFPNQALLYFFNGTAKLQLKKYQEAVEVLLTGKDFVVDNNPLLVQFYANLGEAYYRLKDYKNSDYYFEEVLKIEPDNVLVLNNYSYYLSLRGENLEKAAEMSLLSNKLTPNQANYQDTYGWILYKQEKYNEALEWLLKAYENGGKNNSTILEHIGDTYYKLKQKEKALEYWEKAKNAKGEKSELLPRKIEDKMLYE